MATEGTFVSLATEDRIAVVTLDRPEAMNALSGDFADELSGVFTDLADDGDVWVVLLAAAGEKAFCVGADLKERAGFTLDDFYRNREQVRRVFSSVRNLPQPVVASVFGFALGGGFELALSCDLIVASDDAVFGLPETRVGLIPAGGGTQLLTRKVGVARTKEMIFRGRRIDAAEAKQLGLVAEVTTRDGLAEMAMEVARDICRSSPVAVRSAKSAIDAALGVPIESGIDFEHEAWVHTIASKDRAEGIDAFTNKREPQWNNE